ncbi:hypothetical protein TELCIR_02809 [Teladorsagia circumcincta]|uniref:Uncharacterized protein n=1 Tax=Teladorsagia circumcincta TaxID=45464 RepID=A0A2G9UY37_TELCI|nr:hypothetical protein TELCIR_02809 [Teladorsagia circumcincta]
MANKPIEVLVVDQGFVVVLVVFIIISLTIRRVAASTLEKQYLTILGEAIKRGNQRQALELNCWNGEEQWELIGSRTYKWHGPEALRCKHWDKVAVRWHLSTCGWRHGRRSCNGGTNADLARDPQKYDELPRWRNAFTYAQLPNTDHKDQHLRLALEGYDKKMLEVKLIAPLKIDVDWKWTIGEDGCNNFSVRMSAMSTIEDHKLQDLAAFCRSFDTDGFVFCDNL